MKVFSALLLFGLFVGHQCCLQHCENRNAEDETAAAAPAENPAAPAEKPAEPATPVKPKPGPKPRPPQDPTVKEAEELERKVGKALRLSRGKLDKLEEILGEKKEQTLAKITKVKNELLEKAKIAKKEGKKRLEWTLIRNAKNLNRLSTRISKLK